MIKKYIELLEAEILYDILFLILEIIRFQNELETSYLCMKAEMKSDLFHHYLILSYVDMHSLWKEI